MYTKLDFCTELLGFLVRKKTREEISSWAIEKSCKNFDCDPIVLKDIHKLAFSDIDGCKVSQKEKIHMCVELVKMHMREEGWI